MDPIFFHRNPETATGHGHAAVQGHATGHGHAPDDGRLRGLKVAVQPGIAVKGWPTDAGSHALAGYVALEDATVVQRLREAGAYLCGSIHAAEFGFGLAGGRTGEAVRQAFADIELVLDSIGESRVAAARAGVCGLKPSYGLVSRFGLIGLIPSMECCAVLSRSLDDIRETLRIITGQDGLDFSLPDEEAPDFSSMAIDPGKITIGVIDEAQDALPATEGEEFRASLEALRRRGFTLQEMSLPDFSLFSLVHRIVGSVEASSAAGRYDSVRYGPRAPGAKNWNEMYLLSRAAAFGPFVKSYLIQGAFFQFERYGAFEDACRIRARLVREMRRLTSQVDFLAFPGIDGGAAGVPSGGMAGVPSGGASGDTAAGVPAKGGPGSPGEAPSAPRYGAQASLGGVYAEFASTLFANVTGQPVLYLPSSPGGGRAGIQLTGPRLADGRLLALGESLLETDRKGD